MTTQVTQCPKCRTSFRVTEAQLAIANGAVRCGSCLHIFNAADHWLASGSTPVLEPEVTVGEVVEAPVNTAISPPNADQFNDTPEHNALDTIFDETIFDETTFDDTPFDDTTFEENFSDEDLDSLVEELSDNAAGDETFDTIETENFIFNSNMGDKSTLADNHSGKHIISDDPFALDTMPQEVDPDSDEHLIDDNMPLDDDALINDTGAQAGIEHPEELFDDKDEEEEEDEGEGDTNSGFSHSFLDLDHPGEEPATVFKDLDDIGEDSTSEEEAWTKKLLEEDDLDPPEPTEPADEFLNIFDDEEEEEQKQQTNDQLDPELLDILDDHDQAPAPKLIQEDEFILLGDEAMIAGERIGDNNRALLANIEPEPVEITRASSRNHWAPRISVASIIAATLLFAAQYISFNFDSISRDDSYRPLLAYLCPKIGCQLPDLNDIRLIRSSNLMVRSHSSVDGGLVVDAIISNRATFKQQFPIMELQFTDLSGNRVAGRQFRPEEYLAGELLGDTLMPVKQPIHISLDIVDPGEQAVNYQLRFHPQ